MKIKLLKPIQKKRHKSTLSRPGEFLAQLRQKNSASDLQGYATGKTPARSDGTAPKCKNTVPGGKMTKNPPASKRKKTAADSPWDLAMGTAHDGSYWTLNVPPVSNETRIAWKLGPQRKRAVHSGLCDSFFPTVKALMAFHRTMWDKPGLPHGFQLVRVEPVEAGLKMVIFPCYAAAIVADRARAQLAKLATLAADAVPNLNPCPFCRKSDRLEIINWSHERHDWSNYDGEAVKCNRCDAIATMAAWQKGADLPTPNLVGSGNRLPKRFSRK
jgi:hypothetical protein